MNEKEFDVNYWEDVWDKVRIPQKKDIEDIHELHNVFTNNLPSGKLKFIEIGCAPGSWLCYFFNHFHYLVSGIEYAPRAYEKTIQNLEIQIIPAEVFQADFFEFTHERYNVVFSNGFIEHYEDVLPVIKKIVALAEPDGGFVVTIIPSMQGVNRWISKTFRPHVADGHFPISKNQLIDYHEKCGLQTIYSDYIGSLHFLTPIEKNLFSKKYPSVSKLLNLPFRVWSRIINGITKKICLYPKISFISKSVVYIGKR